MDPDKLSKYKGEGKYDSDELKDMKKKLKVKYNNKRKKWKRERKKKRKSKQKGSDSDDTSSDDSKNVNKEYIGQIMDFINHNINNKKEYCNLAQGNQQNMNIQMQQQKPKVMLRPGTSLGYNQTTKIMSNRIICRRCGQMGHIARHCTNPPQVCGYCGQLGHSALNCWERDINVDKRPEGFISKRMLPCVKCGQTGHLLRDCPLNKNAQTEQDQGVNQHLGMVSLGGRFVDYVPPKGNGKSKRVTNKKRQPKDTLSQISLGSNVWEDSTGSDDSTTSNEEFCGLITHTTNEHNTKSWTLVKNSAKSNHYRNVCSLDHTIYCRITHYAEDTTIEIRRTPPKFATSSQNYYECLQEEENDNDNDACDQHHTVFSINNDINDTKENSVHIASDAIQQQIEMNEPYGLTHQSRAMFTYFNRNTTLMDDNTEEDSSYINWETLETYDVVEDDQQEQDTNINEDYLTELVEAMNALQ